MSATMEDIKWWLEKAKKQKATHLIVACDKFGSENYPVYVLHGEDVQSKINKIHGENMQGIDEVYNMSMDIEKQLDEFRAWHVEPYKKEEYDDENPCLIEEIKKPSQK